MCNAVSRVINFMEEGTAGEPEEARWVDWQEPCVSCEGRGSSPLNPTTYLLVNKKIPISSFSYLK